MAKNNYFSRITRSYVRRLIAFDAKNERIKYWLQMPCLQRHFPWILEYWYDGERMCINAQRFNQRPQRTDWIRVKKETKEVDFFQVLERNTKMWN